MNKRESIHNQIKRLEIKNMDLKSLMQTIVRQISSYTDFDYGDIENVRRLTKILNEHMDEYSKNETAINMIRWTIKELENNVN